VDDGATGTGGNYVTSSIKIVISRVQSNLDSSSSRVFEGEVLFSGVSRGTYLIVPTLKK